MVEGPAKAGAVYMSGELPPLPEMLEGLSWLVLFFDALMYLGGAMFVSLIVGPYVVSWLRAADMKHNLPNVVDAVDIIIAVYRLLIYIMFTAAISVFFIADMSDLVALDELFTLTFIELWIIFGVLWLASEAIRAVMYGFDIAARQDLYRAFKPKKV